MSTGRHTRQRRLLAAVAVCGLVLAACGSDDGDSDSGSTPSETTETTDTAEQPDDTTETGGVEVPDTDETDGAALAAERVAAFREPVAELPLSSPISMEPGTKLFYVQCGVSACAEIDVGIQAAADAAGWEYETASHQDTPDTVASAFDAAIAAQPDVVLTSGNPREWFASQLSTLEEMGVPVVAWSMPEAYEPGDGVSVNLLSDDDYYFYGTLMADYAAVTTETQNILFVGLPTFPVLSTVQQGFEDEIAVACPDCSVDVMEVAVTDLGTNLPGAIVSELQANPDLDMIVYAFGGMLFGVPEAIDSAGLGGQAVAISQAGGPMNFGFIVDGQHQVAEVGLASELMGWRAIDAAARILAGEGPGRADTPTLAVIDGHPDVLAGGLPLQILEASSIEDPSVLWPGVDGFQDQFTVLWAG
ncbi:MAG: substrate-binding domain-containing protein [Ilumatobacteraceae bacterium]